MSLELTEEGRSREEHWGKAAECEPGVTNQNCSSRHSKNRPQGSQDGALIREREKQGKSDRLTRTLIKCDMAAMRIRAVLAHVPQHSRGRVESGERGMREPQM